MTVTCWDEGKDGGWAVTLRAHRDAAGELVVDSVDVLVVPSPEEPKRLTYPICATLGGEVGP